MGSLGAASLPSVVMRPEAADPVHVEAPALRPRALRPVAGDGHVDETRVLLSQLSGLARPGPPSRSPGKTPSCLRRTVSVRASGSPSWPVPSQHSPFTDNAEVPRKTSAWIRAKPCTTSTPAPSGARRWVTHTARGPNRDAKVEVTLAAGIIVADRGSTARAARSGL